MTNQKAIEILRQYDVSDLHFYTTDGEEIPFTEWSDALELAISALQAQDIPVINVGDINSETQKELNALFKKMAAAPIQTVQPEPSVITDEQAIMHLQLTGWMQNHDREIYESGLREQLADDSGSYDNLIPCEDAISRTDAIEAVEHITSSMSVCVNTDECHGMKRMQRQAVIELVNLPSTQLRLSCDGCKHKGEWENEVEYGYENDDLISRQAAIDILDDYQVMIENGEKNPYAWARLQMSELLSAQSETARRIVRKSMDGMIMWYQCDMCDEPVDKQDAYCCGCGRRFVDE